MSVQNVEVFKRVVDAYNRRDLDAILNEFDPAVEWHPLNQVMFGQESRVYRGHEDIRHFMREVDEAFDAVQLECLEIHDLGERLVVVGRLTARGKASGAETESPIAWVADFRDGKVIWLRDYLDPNDALGAAGLSE
jgi:ketosteroid isomerase-like protein